MKVKEESFNAQSFRVRKTHHYLNKYYNIFMNSYKFSGEIDYQQIDFVLRKFWRDGCVACFPLRTEIKNRYLPITSKEHPNGVPVFTMFNPNGWNIYDFPTSVNLINTKGVNFIPSTSQVIDKDVVIGYVQRNKKGVAEYVEEVVDDIVTAEILIKLNLNAHKMPWVIVCNPDNEKKMKEFYKKIANDDPELFVSADEIEGVKVLTSGASYIIDKLYNYKMARENELREYFGQNNVGVGEKKEHLISDEVDANNEVVEASGGCLIDPMKEFFKRVEDIFGIQINVEYRENTKPNETYMNQEEEAEDEIDVE